MPGVTCWGLFDKVVFCTRAGLIVVLPPTTNRRVAKQAGEQQVLPLRGVLQLLALRGVAEVLQVGGGEGGSCLL